MGKTESRMMPRFEPSIWMNGSAISEIRTIREKVLFWGVLFFFGGGLVGAGGGIWRVWSCNPVVLSAIWVLRGELNHVRQCWYHSCPWRIPMVSKGPPWAGGEAGITQTCTQTGWVLRYQHDIIWKILWAPWIGQIVGPHVWSLQEKQIEAASACHPDWLQSQIPLRGWRWSTVVLPRTIGIQCLYLRPDNWERAANPAPPFVLW